MRIWIYNRTKGIAEVAAIVGDRVIASGAADRPEPPFIVIQMGVEQPPLGLPTSAGAQSVPWTAWCHDDPRSMLNVDNLSVALKSGIPTRDGFTVGGMSVYEVRWEETGDDSYDDHFKTNCRPVRFTMMTRR